ncbi:HAD-IC family P-type ATPase [Mariniluteicoccus endophyticus]
MDSPTAPVTALTGLTSDEVRARQAEGKTNAGAAGPTRSVWTILRTNLFNLFNNILFVIGAGLVALGRYNDAFTSVGLGLVNALIGTAQEVRAKRQLDQISLTTRVPATVVREGVRQQIPPEEIVLGDVLVVGPGDQVLVDGEVTGDAVLGLDESLLTGEADVLVKAPGASVLSGSVVVKGEGCYVATGVGEDSYAHALTASARQFVPTQTPLQRQVDIVVRVITFVVALMSFAILFQAALEGFSLTRVVQVVAVLSGQIPYGLFFLIALAYAVGAATLAKKGALVQQTNAVEALSNIDTICLDKTGTLTTNRLQLAELVALGGTDEEVRRVLGAYAHSTTAPNGTSEALATGLPGTAVEVVEVPFTSATKWSAQSLPAEVLGDRAADWATLVLGAPEVLAPLLADPAGFAAAGGVRQGEWSDRGLRVLLLAASTERAAEGFTPRALVPVALLALKDELRPHALETLQMLKTGGVDIKIISGDSPRTVAALARQADRGPDIRLVTGPELDAMSDGELAEAAKTATIFGRATPAHKERLVLALKAQGRSVAMLGDGTNDALSLKRADVGIAMESGAQITRNVADMVLLKDSFAAIGPAIVEGRRIVDGLTKSVFLFLPRVITSILVIVFTTMLGFGFPYSPAQVALTLFTVGIPSLALTAWARPDPVRPHVLRRIVEFALPAGIVTAIFATSIYAFFHEIIATSIESNHIPPGAAEAWSAYTGVAVDTADFREAAATIIAQTAMSTFVAFCAFGLILFVEPPIKLFTGWSGVSPDKRPAWLALALAVVYLVVLHVEVTASYFGLLTPHGPEWEVYAVAVPLWFVTLRTAWRHRLFPRMLGLERHD